jgi:nitroreductase
MDMSAAIQARHSTRSYRPDPIPRETLEAIVEAGRLATTARNEQPWEFVVVTDAATRRAIADFTEYGKFIAQAPACLAVLCQPTRYYLEDGSAASQAMLLAAAGLGVQSCWIAGDKKAYAPQIVSLLGAPSQLKLVSLLALGYEATAVPRAAKRTLGQVLHWEKF